MVTQFFDDGTSKEVPVKEVPVITGPDDVLLPNYSGVQKAALRTSAAIGTGDMTKAVYDAAAVSEQLVGRTATQTLTNKTLTTPIISSISNTGTITLPTATDTLVGRATTDTLTNKSIAETQLTFTDITTGNASTSQHGYLLKLGGGSTNFLRADGTWNAPTGGKAIKIADSTPRTADFSTTSTSYIESPLSGSITTTVTSTILAWTSDIAYPSTSNTQLFMRQTIDGTVGHEMVTQETTANQISAMFNLHGAKTGVTSGTKDITTQVKVNANTGTWGGAGGTEDHLTIIAIEE